jgi:hypothetical protein
MKVGAFLGVVVILAVLAVACGGSEAAPEGTATPAPRTISGQIIYTGSALANHKIIVTAVRSGVEGAPVYVAVLTSAGAYTLTNVADSSYNIFAFIDLGDDMGSPQPDEPSGWYDPGDDGVPDSVIMQDGNPATGVDITIRDH